MADFSVDVSDWVAKARERADEAFQAIAFDLLRRVQELTPVDTGFLRSNWTALRPGDTEPVAGRVSGASDVIDSLRAGEIVVIINPVIYARRVEFGFVGQDSLGRNYNQPGRHMVAQTMAEAPQIAEAAVARLAAA
jgi:hypothetical protein